MRQTLQIIDDLTVHFILVIVREKIQFADGERIIHRIIVNRDQQLHKLVARCIGPELNALDDSGKILLHEIPVDILYHSIHIRSSFHE